MLRKTVFWIHLSAGVIAGLVIFTMSLTGVLLTYERQIKRWMAESHYVPAAQQQGQRLSLVQLLAAQQQQQPEARASAVLLTNEPGAPVSFRAGRRPGIELNPYNASPMQTESAALNENFGAIERFHRWFSIEGENREVARQVTGVCNALFLFLILSGMYLWLPPMWKTAMFKARLCLRGDYSTSKVRDFHWHHVFGMWMAIPLAAIVYSSTIMSYPKAANAMYFVFGVDPPAAPAAREERPQRPENPAGRDESATAPAPAYLSLDDLVAKALADERSTGWNRLTLNLPAATANTVQVEIDRGNGAQAQLRHTLSLDRTSGAITGSTGFADIPDAQRLRGITRFLHTGEVLGFWGQTIAGLASAAAMLLVWTGLALAFRRLIQPLFERNA